MEYKEFMSPDNMAMIRGRLLMALDKTGISMSGAAFSIGVAWHTLLNFVHGKRVYYKTLRKIDRWVENVLKTPEARA